MKYRIAICDDESACVDKISKAIPHKDYEQRSYSSPRQLLEDVKNNIYIPDIIFMDIMFKNENGIDAVKKIQAKNSEAKVIYISGYPHYAEKIFETEPTAFLIKPVTDERVVYALDKAVRALYNSIENIVDIKTPSEIFRINKTKVMYIESNARKISIVFEDNVIETYAKLNDIVPLFSEFCRCHQSFLVNYRYVISLNHNTIKLSNNMLLPVSKSKYNSVKTEFAKYLGGLI